MNNIKFFAVNSGNKDVINALMQMQGQGSYEIDSALFDRANESYTRTGLANTMLIGNLVTDPKVMVDPLKKRKSGNKTVGQNVDDYISDDNYIYEATFCYETDVYWDKKTNKRHSRNNYIDLFFNTKGAKSMITHYQKGDAMIVHGYLRSISQDHPSDPTRRINISYLVVTDFIATPGTHIRREIREQMSSKSNNAKKYKSLKEIFSDTTLSDAEQNELARKFLAEQDASESDTKVTRTSQFSDNNREVTEVTNYSAPQPQQNNFKNSDADYEDGRISSLQNESENYFEPELDDLSSAFDDEF